MVIKSHISQKNGSDPTNGVGEGITKTPVRAIAAQPFEIYSLNFTDRFTSLRQCVMNKKDLHCFNFSSLPLQETCTPEPYGTSSQNFTVWFMFRRKYVMYKKDNYSCFLSLTKNRCQGSILKPYGINS